MLEIKPNGILGGLKTFRHGVHPEEGKELTNGQPIERMPFVEEYTLPLSQHIGAPSRAIVRTGQRVRRGELIAEPTAFVSVGLHAPVDGTVMAIGLFPHPNGEMGAAIRIKADPFSSQSLGVAPPLPPEHLSVEEFTLAVQRAGLVGMGGAAFPAHVKFSIPEGRRCRYLMLNGCECEPFLTCDHRLMVEYADELIDGTGILQHFVQAEKIYIAIEANKPDAIAALKEKAAHSRLPLEVVALQVKYPQGAEKMMISAILGQEVPGGKLPLDIGVLVSNVGTIIALSAYFRKGLPLIERVVTVTGPAVRRPANVLVPLGTPMQAVVDFCGGIDHQAARLLLGGPMMGVVQKSLDVPLIKGISGILALTDREVSDFDTYSCVRCGRCLDACPLSLNPARLGLLARKGLWEEMQAYNLMDCFECGACSYACPSGIPLVQSFRVAKTVIRAQQAKQKPA